MKTVEKSASVDNKWEIPVSKIENERSDREIAAWEEGKRDGLTEYQRGLNLLMKANLNIAYSITSKLIDVVKRKRIVKPEVKLRINSFDCFDIILLIPEDIFHSEKSDSIYSEITKLEKDCGDLNLHFSLIGFSQNTDYGLINLEGFTYNYVYNEPRTRKS
jgi:hypothetical protein